jgi:uracil-DNA glycosylase
VTDAERAAALETIADEIRTCTRCRLHEQRDRAVPGEGDPDTEVVVVGEGPGRDENTAGRPFVGASGRLLGELIGSLGWRREDVFITNVVKCWPPGNRDPQPDEIAACAPYLRRQLEVLDPAVVVTVGKHSLGSFMPGERIGRVHGTSRPADPATGARDALVFAMYHPAFALYDGSNRAILETDIAGLPATLLAARGRRSETGAMGETAPSADATAPEADVTAPAEATPSADATAPPADLALFAPANLDLETPADDPATAPDPVPAGALTSAGDPPDADQLTLF